MHLFLTKSFALTQRKAFNPNSVLFSGQRDLSPPKGGTEGWTKAERQPATPSCCFFLLPFFATTLSANKFLFLDSSRQTWCIFRSITIRFLFSQLVPQLLSQYHCQIGQLVRWLCCPVDVSAQSPAQLPSHSVETKVSKLCSSTINLAKTTVARSVGCPYQKRDQLSSR